MSEVQTWATLVRHYRENRKKCTLEPLLHDPRFRFQTWRVDSEIEGEGQILLATDAEELTEADSDRRLLLVDSTWRYLPRMLDSLRGPVVRRSLPLSIESAYPRHARLSEEPANGLASIEALYAALRMQGKRDDSLLASYHWREEFLRQFD